MSAGARAAETQRGPVIRLLLTWDREREGREGKRGRDSYRIGYRNRDLAGGGIPSFTLHMSRSFSQRLSKNVSVSHFLPISK